MRHAVGGAVLTTLAILTKPLVLGILPGLVLFVAWDRKGWLRRGLIVSGMIVIGLGPYAAWDRWANHLLKTEMNGVGVISIEHVPAEMLANLRNVAFTREALFHFLPNYTASWWLVPALIAGVFRAFSDHRLRRFGVPFAVWLAGYLVELLAFGNRLHSNAYYFILAPAPVAFFCAIGLGGLVRALESPRHRPPLLLRQIGLALVVLLPLGMLRAQRSNWSSTAIPDLGFLRNSSVWTNDMGLALLLIVFLIAIAPRLRIRNVPAWTGIAVFLAVFSSSVTAFRDARQYFAFYAGLQKREHFDAELSALRAAINERSHEGDRILVNSSEFVPFYYALRNGFFARDAKTPAKLAAMRARGVRLYVHVDPPGTVDSPPDVKGDLVAKGAWWRLYCLDSAGCAR